MAAVNDYGAKICVKTIRFPVSEDAESEVPFIFFCNLDSIISLIYNNIISDGIKKNDIPKVKAGH